MKYLTIIPDYTQSCVQDEFDGRVELETLQLPKHFIDEILVWHNAYRKIIPLDNEQRDTMASKIEELDNQGLKIAKNLAELIPGGAKVKYFSEGKLKYLFV